MGLEIEQEKQDNQIQMETFISQQSGNLVAVSRIYQSSVGWNVLRFWIFTSVPF